MQKKYRLAIVGATGLVGRKVLEILEEKNLPNFEYVLFASSKSAGKKIAFLGKEYIVQELTDSSFDSKFDYAIFSAGGCTALHYAPIAASKGCIVIDNSSAFRMEKTVPLVVPEVNPQDAFSHHGIIANPNCSTIQAVVTLAPIDKKYGIKRIVYATYQAVSGAGQKGLQDLKKGTETGYILQKFPYPILNNCLPHIDGFLEDGSTKEEQKMVDETKKILHRPDLKISATAVRVPVENCHGEAINLELQKDFSIQEIKELLKTSPGIIVKDDPNSLQYPIATEVSGHDEVFVGRIRRDPSLPYGLNLWVVADNIRKGAATNAVQILELLQKGQ